MDTIARVMQLADERNLSLFKLSQLCDVGRALCKCCHWSEYRVKAYCQRIPKAILLSVDRFDFVRESCFVCIQSNFSG